MSQSSKKNPVVLSIGIMACNEEGSIAPTLESLFRQSVFERLVVRHEQCEIVVVANACTDRTIAVTREVFERMERDHDWSDGFSARIIDIPEPGRANAWNRFIHEFSAVEARFVCSMDAHIVFHHRDTIYNLMATLERKPHVPASTDRPCNALMLKESKTLRERIALATSAMTIAEPRRISRQLFCLRAAMARNLYLPRDLTANEDGFIKEVVCTDFLTRPSNPMRIAVAHEAAHLFEAPVATRDVLHRETRKLVGQTAVHVLIEYLKTLSWDERVNLAETLRRHEARNPDWLKTLIAAHVRRRRFFWQLFPGVATFRFQRLLALPGLRKVSHLPAACAGFALTLAASAGAHRALRTAMQQYGEKTKQPAAVSVPQTAK